MLKTSYLKVILVGIFLILAAGIFLWRNFQGASLADKSDLIQLKNVAPNSLIKSPLIVIGFARGYWFFEASFPIKLLDGNGKEIGLAIAQAQDEWMTENFVPFKATLEFKKPATDNGTIVLEKDNPSGLPEHADELRIPVRF
ncbi:MAG: Gmad2 immunoglobulin-like domain-containing protein [bacterium]|nr:Gmad2 immunoglobulin-like domain-containing protein [bacterium]